MLVPSTVFLFFFFLSLDENEHCMTKHMRTKYNNNAKTLTAGKIFFITTSTVDMCFNVQLIIMKQIGIRYLWSTLNLLHIAVLLVTVVYYCFRAKFFLARLCDATLNHRWIGFGFSWYFFSLIPPGHCRFSLFLSSWALKFFRIYFAHLNHINHQLNRNQIPNEMTVLKWDSSWCWLLLPMKNYIQLPISYYCVRYIQCASINLICLHSKKELIRHFGYRLQALCMTNDQWAPNTRV